MGRVTKIRRRDSAIFLILGKNIWWEPLPGNTIVVGLARCKIQSACAIKGGFLVGLSAPTQTELFDFRGKAVFAPASDFTRPSFARDQIEGMAVLLASGEQLGTVHELLKTGGNDVLVVRTDSKEYLVPFTAQIVTDIDVSAKRLVVAPSPGLFD